MRAIVCHRYGSPDVLECVDVDEPVPAADEVLIRVRAAAVNPLDWRLMKGRPYVMRLVFGLRKPRRSRPGVDVAGQVEAVGKSVTRFEPGDAVFGSCRGAFAEYACAPESALARKPEGVTWEQAASAPVAAYTALQGLRDKGRLRAGQRVLINGAAGGVGTFAVQIAKFLGAAEITGVCSTRNLDRVRSIGADRAVDYTREDFTRGTQHYDLLFDCIGNHSFAACRRILEPQGVCVLVGGPSDFWDLVSGAVESLVYSRFVSQRFVSFIARRSAEDLALIGELMATKKVTPVIDRCYALGEVPEAIRYVETGHARGKVVIRLERS